ncbi:hypothetical protein ACIRU3_18795 [Streptomyces sp. NPDC101151]|uniref:hypothetical protein n=1 Tax=Streptomyces sp. NPDC101151 TaxID=3366115 RepID=UPI003829232D
MTAAPQRPALTTNRLDPPSAAQVARVVHALMGNGAAEPLPGIEPALVRRRSA